MVQINLSLPDKLATFAEKYADAHGFGTIQELAREALREMVFGRRLEYDEDITEDEKKIIEKFVPLAIESGLGTEADLRKALQA